MRSGLRILATILVAFLLLPALLAQDSAKPAATAKKDAAVKAPGAPGAVVKAKPAAGASMPGTEKRHLGDATNTFPRVELYTGFSYLRNVPASVTNRIDWVPGGTMSLAINANRYLGFVGDFGAYHATNFGPGAPPTGGTVPAYGDVFSYMFGPRISFRHERVTPFIQALFGGVHASDVTLNGCTGIGCTPLPFENAFAMAAGGGVDVTVTRHIAIRVIQAEYMMTRFEDPTSSTHATGMQNDMRLSAGIVIRLGGSHRPPPPPPPPPPQPPVAACSADKGMVYAESGDALAVHAQASSPDNLPLTYTWTATGGAVGGTGSDVQWNSSGLAVGAYTVSVRVDDGRGGRANCSVGVRVDPRPNRPPTISCSADHNSIMPGEPVQITATASDPDNDPLTFTWSASGGRTVGTGTSVRFDTSGLAAGHYTVMGRVDDGRGGSANCSVDIEAQANAAVPIEVTTLEAKLALHSIYFPTAQPSSEFPNAGLLGSQETTLRTLAEDFKRYMTFKPDAHLILEGHADQRGSEEYNKALTDRRVERSRSFLIEHGVPAGSIQTKSFGKEKNLDAAQVKAQLEENPDVTSQDRERFFSNMQVIVLAQNRRVDIVLSTTGATSVRRYPFNAHDALTLLSPARTGTAKRTAPAATTKPRK